MAYNYDRRTASLTQRDLAALRYLATPTWTITMSTDMLAAANRLEKRGLVVYTARPPNRAGKLMGGDFRATAAGLRELSLAAARDDSTEE